MKWVLACLCLSACQQNLLLMDESNWGLTARVRTIGPPVSLEVGASRTLLTNLPEEGADASCESGSLGSVAVISQGNLDWNEASGLSHVIATGAAAEQLSASGRVRALQGAHR